MAQLFYNYTIENNIGGREDWSDTYIEQCQDLIPLTSIDEVEAEINFKLSNITSPRTIIGRDGIGVYKDTKHYIVIDNSGNLAIEGIRTAPGTSGQLYKQQIKVNNKTLNVLCIS